MADIKQINVSGTTYDINAVKLGGVASTDYAIKPANNTFDGEQKMINSSYCPTMNDIASGIGCSLKNSRACDNQLIVAEVYAPLSSCTDSTINMQSVQNEISFYSINGANSGQFSGKTLLGKIGTSGWIGDVVGNLTGNADNASRASSSGTADEATHAVSSDEATHAEVANVSGAFSSAATIELTGDVTGSASSTHGWTVEANLEENTVTSSHIVDSSIGLSKLADEVGVVVVQSEEPASNSAAKIWIKI